MEKFTPTHKIFVGDDEKKLRAILVREFEGEKGRFLYTEGEWDCFDFASFTLTPEGELEFQGEINYPWKYVRLIRL